MIRNDIPHEVKDLFNWRVTHWKIIERVIDNEGDVTINDLYAMIDNNGTESENYINTCINELSKSGWLREISPAGTSINDRTNDIIECSLFAKVAIGNMLKCMDMSNELYVKYRNEKRK